MSNLTEKQLHKQICDYLKIFYPKILFNTDLSGLRLSIGQAKQIKNLRSSNGFPDIVIYAGSEETKEISKDCYESTIYAALFLEVKKESPFKKDLTLKKNDHLIKQYSIIKKLNDLGYLALFVWNFEDAKIVIDKYLTKK